MIRRTLPFVAALVAALPAAAWQEPDRTAYAGPGFRLAGLKEMPLPSYVGPETMAVFRYTYVAYAEAEQSIRIETFTDPDRPAKMVLRRGNARSEDAFYDPPRLTRTRERTLTHNETAAYRAAVNALPLCAAKPIPDDLRALGGPDHYFEIANATTQCGADQSGGMAPEYQALVDLLRKFAGE